MGWGLIGEISLDRRLDWTYEENMVQTATVQNADRMMLSIKASFDGLGVSFADGLVFICAMGQHPRGG